MIMHTSRNLRDERWSTQEKRHFAFLQSLRRCALSGASVELEVAHIRVHTGMALKPHWRHVLPLRHQIHIHQEKSGLDWWEKAGFPIGSDNDPRIWAERLAEATGNPEACDDTLRDMLGQTNRDFIYQIMTGRA
ncbi:hypothetical protein MHM86_02695 [Thalassobius sp. Cn5-15]|nr:hypothetical protein [Thalassobius sp. Cn5-15]